VETVTESERHPAGPATHIQDRLTARRKESTDQVSFPSTIDVFKAVPVKSSGIRIKLCVGSCPTWTARRQRSFHEVTG